MRNEKIETLAGFSIGVVDGSHLEAVPEAVHGDPRLANPFENFDELYPVKPAVIYVVTDAMRRADERERAEREAKRVAAIAWTPPRPIATPEPANATMHVHRQPAAPARRERAPRFCATGCGAQISRGRTKTGTCIHCFQANRPVKPAKPLRPCIDGCGAAVSVGSRTGRCKACHYGWLKSPEGKDTAVVWRGHGLQLPEPTPILEALAQ